MRRKWIAAFVVVVLLLVSPAASADPSNWAQLAQIVLGPCQSEVDALRDRRRVAAGALAVCVEHLDLVPVCIGREERDVPAVRMLRRNAQRHFLAAPSDPQR